ARRGHGVDLYDERAEAMAGASGNNEGKIHLGLIYARDPSMQSAQTMIQGAVHFLKSGGASTSSGGRAGSPMFPAPRGRTGPARGRLAERRMIATGMGSPAPAPRSSSTRAEARP